MTIATNSGETMGDLAIDEINNKVYWTTRGNSFGAGRIHRANWDGANHEVVLQSPLTGPGLRPGGIDLDLANGKIYFTNYLQPGSICRVNLDGTGFESLVVDDLPLALALDLTHGHMFWSAQSRIERWTLDGATGITATNNTPLVRALDVDEAGGKLYWVDNGYPDGRFMMANLDGSNQTLISHSRPNYNGVEYDPTHNVVYLSGEFSSRILRYDPARNSFDIVVEGVVQAQGLAFTPVPEPSTIALAIIAGVILLSRCRWPRTA